MKCIVLDTRNGDTSAELFIFGKGGARLTELRLGYVPALSYDTNARELIVHDTETPEDTSVATRYWLKSFATDTFEQRLRIETPERPMYSGHPSRSTGISASPSSRYLYFLSSQA